MVFISALLCLLGVGVVEAADPSTNALPTNGQVAAGTASISTAGSVDAPVMHVNQTSQRAIVNWDKFDVGTNATVNFNQPNAQASTLNRINDSNPSQIFGKINAPGEVVLVNQAGVYFSPSSSLDVGAVVATSHHISDADYMAGKSSYDRKGATGKVINEGNIKTALGGYVALLAPEVRNSGVIVAQMGTVVMAAGERVTLNFDPSRHLTTITTTPSAIATLIENHNAVKAPGGLIILSGNALNNLVTSLVRQNGTLEASADTSGFVTKGGRILISGNHVKLETGSKTVARGPAGGGEVQITATQTATIDTGAKVSVSATESGNAGKIAIHADEKTTINGTLLAQGGKVSGNGGTISTTSHGHVEVGATAEFKAGVRGASGEVGTWNLTTSAFKITTAVAGVISQSINTNNVAVNVSTPGCVALGTCAQNNTPQLVVGQLTVDADAVIQKTSPLMTVLSMNGEQGVSLSGRIDSSVLSPLTLQIFSQHGVELQQISSIVAREVRVAAQTINALGFINTDGGSGSQIFLAGAMVNILGSMRANGQTGNSSNALTSSAANSTVTRRNNGINGGLNSVTDTYLTEGGHISILASGDIAIGSDAWITANGTSGGHITIASKAGQVKVSGVIDSVGKTASGGNMIIAGKTYTELIGALISVDGLTQGGFISIGLTNVNGSGSILAPPAMAPPSTASPAFIALVNQVFPNSFTVISSVVNLDTSGISASASTALQQANNQASNDSQFGGTVHILGDAISLTGTTQILATGTNGGGTVLVGGDWQGSNGVYQATTVNMASGTSIDASAIQNGNGGKVVLWSDITNANSTTAAYGSIKAEGGANGGNGGQIETSGYYLNIENLSVSAGAPKGLSGEWLIDPFDVTIAATGASGTAYSPNYTPSSTSTILASSIVTSLNANTNVSISTGSASSNTIYVNAAISATGTGSLTLTGQAIQIGANITTGGAQTYNGAVVLTAGVTLTTTNSNITFGSTVNSDTSPRSLTIANGTGTTFFNGAVGGTNALGSITRTGSGLTSLLSNLTTTGNISISGNLEIGQTTLTTSNGDVTIGGAVQRPTTVVMQLNANGAYLLNGSSYSSTSTAVTLAGLGMGTLSWNGSTYTWTPTGAASVTYLLVGGGGGGGGGAGGGWDAAGGGAGGAVSMNTINTSVNGYSLVIGAGGNGGAGGGSTYTSGNNGGTGGVSSITSGGTTLASAAGGAGGGAAWWNGRTGTFTGGGGAASGGGGAGGAGSGASGGPNNGGTGTYSDYSGTGFYYSGGGGGGANYGSTRNGAGGTSGGGAGGCTSCNGSGGTANTGGGGGGSGGTPNSSAPSGGSGGSGTIVLKFAATSSLTINSGSGKVTLAALSNLDSATITSSNTASTVTGVMSGGAFTYAGSAAGVLTLSGNNTYTGLTTISSGTLVATNANSLGNISGSTTIASGAILDIQASLASEPVTVNGGTLSTSTGSGSLSGAVTLGASSTIDVTGTRLTLSGAISSSATYGITKIGSGEAVFSAANTYTGATTISAGKLSVTSSGTLGNSTSLLTINNSSGSATLDLQRALTVGSLSMGGTTPSITNSTGTSSLTVTGTAALAGAITTSGTQTYSGAVTVSADSSLTTTNSAINFNSTVNNLNSTTGGVLTTAAGSGVVTFTAIVGGTTPLSGFTSTGSGGVTLNTTALSTNGNVAITGDLTAPQTATLTTNNGDFTVSGALVSTSQLLTLYATGSYILNGVSGTASGTGSGTLLNASMGYLKYTGVVGSVYNYTWTPGATGIASVLTVGGGGGGGGHANVGYDGGGGGEGGALAQANFNLSTSLANISVGAGGSGGIYYGTSSGTRLPTTSIQANSGGDSAFTQGSSSVSASGGAGGFSSWWPTQSGTWFGAAGDGNGNGGGGGSAFQAPSNSAGFNGSAGNASSITGASIVYGGGGGGGAYSNGAATSSSQGGAGGGGAGGSGGGNGASGTSGLGGGGGGAGGAPSSTVGGAGGAGTVIISYQSVGVTINAGSGKVTLSGGSSGQASLTINSTSNASSAAGVISGGTTLNYTGGASGVLLLSGNNTYSGLTTINSGVIKVGSATALGSSTLPIVVNSGAAIDLNGITMTGANPINISGTGVSNSGAIFNSNSTGAAYAGLITLTGDSSFVGGTGLVNLTNSSGITGSGFAITLGGSIGGSISSPIATGIGVVNKTGLGIWTLTGANTYTGTTTVSGGVLALDGLSTTVTNLVVGALGSVDLKKTASYTFGALTINNGGTITNSAGTSAILVTGATSISGSSTAAVTTTGSQTYDGAVTLTGDTKLVASANIGFGGTIDSDGTTPRALTLSAGSGNVMFGKAVGATNIIGALDATGSTGIVAFYGTELNTNGAITVGGDLGFVQSTTITTGGNDLSVGGAMKLLSPTVLFTGSGNYQFGTSSVGFVGGIATSSSTQISGTAFGNISWNGTSYAWTAPTGVTSLTALAVGGGGGAGGAGGSSYLGGGGGGGGGGYATINETIVSGQSISVAVGLGGSGGAGGLLTTPGSAGTAGSSGGQTQITSTGGFVALTANGGGAGGGGTTTGVSGGGVTPTPGAAGVGGTASVTGGTATIGSAGGSGAAANGVIGITSSLTGSTVSGGGGTGANAPSTTNGLPNGGTLSPSFGNGGSGTAGALGGTGSSGNSGVAGLLWTSPTSNLTIQIVAGKLTVSNGVTGVTALQVDSTNSANSIGGVVSGSGTTLVFNGANGGNFGSLTLSGNNTYTGLTTINGGTLVATNNNSLGNTGTGTVVNADGTLDIRASIGAEPVTVNGGVLATTTGSGSLSGVVTLGANSSVSTGASASLNLTGEITSGSNAYGISKTGTGTVILSAGNTFTGGTTVSTGILKVNHVTALGANSSGVSVTSGAAIDINGITMTGTNQLTLNGTGISSGGSLFNSSSTSGTYAGLITLGSDSSIVGGTGAITISNAGTITGAFGLNIGGASGGSIASIIGTGTGSLTKVGAGTWVLSGANTYSGNTSINAGTLQITSNDGLGATSGITTVASGATLDLHNVSSAEPVTLNGGTLKDVTSTLSGAVTLTANSFLTATNSGDVLNVTGGISQSGGTYGVTIGGLGKVVIGTTGATYQGATTISSGTLQVTSSLSDTTAVSVAAGATYQVSSNDTIGSLTGAAGVNGPPTMAASSVVLDSGKTLSTGADNTSSTMAGIISGSGAIEKVGTGIFTLSGANTYTGATTISAGTLAVANGGTVGNGSAVTISNPSGTATLDLQTGVTIGSLVMSGSTPSITNSTGTSSLTVTGTSTLANSVTTSGAQTYTDAVTLGANTALTTTSNSGDVQFSNTINGAHALTISANTYTNTTFIGVVGGSTPITGLSVTAGTFTASDIATASSSVVSINVSGESGDSLISGVISGTGTTFTKSGLGKLALGSVNTYTGATTVSAGILYLGVSDPFSGTSSSITVNSGATLDLNGGSINNAVIVQGVGFTPAATLAVPHPLPIGALYSSAGTGTIMGDVTIGGATYIGGGTLSGNVSTGGVTISGKVLASTNQISFIGGGNYSLTNADNEIATIAAYNIAATSSPEAIGSLNVVSKSNMTLGSVTSNGTTFAGAVANGDILLKTTGTFTIASGQQIVSANKGIAITTSRFVNNEGATAFFDNTNWTVFSTNSSPFSGSTPDVDGSLAFDYKQYNVTSSDWAGTTPTGPHSGNGLLYSYAPTINVTLSTPATAITKIYDGNTNSPTLVIGNYSYSTTGVDGDKSLAINIATGGTYNDVNVLLANTVTVTGVTYASGVSSNATGNKPVYGYVIADSTGTPSSPAGTLSGAGSITPKTVTLSASKEYDGTTSLTGAVTIGGLIGTQTLNYTGATANSANVGTGNYVNAITLTNGTGTASNYQLPSLTAAATGVNTANITAKGLTVNATTQNITYGDTVPALTYTYTGQVSGETPIFTGALSTTATSTSNVGNYAIVQNTLAATGNYSISTYNAANVVIGAKTVTLSASKEYDGTTSLTGVVTIGGLIGSQALNYTGATANSANVGSGNYVNAITLTDGTGLATNYQLPTLNATNAPVTITAKSLIITGFAVANQVYSGSTSVEQVTNWGSVQTGVGTQTLVLNSNNVTPTFNSKNAGTQTVTATGYVLENANDGSGGLASNYILTNNSATTTATITQRALTITGQLATAKTYDGNNLTTLTGGSLVGVVSGDTVLLTQQGGFASANVAYSGGTVIAQTVTPANTIGGTDSANYSLTQPSNMSAIISPVAVTVSGVTASDKVYDGTRAATLNATNALYSGLVAGETITLTPSDGLFNNATAANNKSVSYTSAYAYSNGAVAGNYTITNNTITANITPKAITISSLVASNKVYDGTLTATVPTVNVTTGIGSESIDVTATGTFADKNVGNSKSVAISSSYSAGASTALSNYSITGQTTSSANITAKSLTISGITADNKTYDGTTAATVNTAAATLSGIVAGDTVTLTGTTGVFASANVAYSGPTVTSQTVTLTPTLGGLDKGNYSITSPPTTTATINPANMIITANNDAKLVGGTTTTGFNGASYAGFVNNENTSNLTGTLAISRSGTSELPGVYTLTASGQSSGNYNIAYATGNFTIVPADQILVKVSNQTLASNSAQTYGATPSFTITSAQYVGTVGGTQQVITLVVTGSGNTFTATDNVAGGSATFTINPINAVKGTGGYINVGGYQLNAINVTTTAGVNFSNTIEMTGALDVKQKVLTASVVSADKPNKVYDGSSSISGINVSLTGVVANDLVTAAAGAASYGSPNVSSTAAYDVSNIVLSGTDAANYTLNGINSLSDSNGVITPKAVSVSGVSADNKSYDGTTNATVNNTGALTGVIAGETVTLAVSNGQFANANAGTSKTVTFTSSYTAGANTSLSNYAITDQASTTANITPKAVSVSGATVNNKVYDRTTDAVMGNNGSISTGVSGETITVSSTGVFTDANAGIAKDVTITSTYAAGSGTLLSNYTITGQTVAQANITAKTLTLAGSSGVTKVYDGTTNLPTGEIGYGALTGIITGDAVNLSGTAIFSAAGAGSRNIEQGNLSLGGANAGNYVLSWTNGSGTISKAALTITANNASKLVGQSDAANFAGVSYSGLVNGEASSEVNTTSLVVSRTGTETSAGVYNNVLTPSGATASNYEISYAQGNYQIVGYNQLLVSFAHASVIYGSTPIYTLASGTNAQYVTQGTGGNPDVFHTVTASLGNNNLVTVTDGGAAVATFTVNFKLAPQAQQTSGAGQLIVGTYNLGATSLTVSTSDFSNSIAVDGTLSVTQKALTASLAIPSKTYDGNTTMNGVTVNLTGLVDADAVIASASGTFGSKDVGANKTYNVIGTAISGNDSANYYLTSTSFSGGNGLINSKVITVSGITAANKSYDGNTNATVDTSSAVFTGLVAGESIGVDATGTFTNKNAGTAKTVTLLSSYTGAAAANYTITDQGSTTADITAKAITVSGITADSKVYDGTSTATTAIGGITYSNGSFISGDVIVTQSN